MYTIISNNEQRYQTLYVIILLYTCTCTPCVINKSHTHPCELLNMVSFSEQPGCSYMTTLTS